MYPGFQCYWGSPSWDKGTPRGSRTATAPARCVAVHPPELLHWREAPSLFSDNHRISDVVVDANRVFNSNPVVGGGNTAIYTWRQYPLSCGPTTISNNIADAIQPSCLHSGFWDGGGCGTSLSGNTFGELADAVLTARAAVFEPPPIPPEPKNCVVPSPYSTQTGWRRCRP